MSTTPDRPHAADELDVAELQKQIDTLSAEVYALRIALVALADVDSRGAIVLGAISRIAPWMVPRR